MPPSRLARLPWWVSHWLGYRTETPKPLPTYHVAGFSFIVSFCGLSVMQALFNYSHYFTGQHVPGIIASFGASAVLCFGSIESPLAHPRALVFGHFISALIGVCVIKLFSLIPDKARFEYLRWLAASLSTALSVALMQLSGTTHPPAGATALLPAVNQAVYKLSWYFLPVVLLSSMLLLVCALLLNNLHRRYPEFWLAPDSEPSEGKDTPASVQQGPGGGSVGDGETSAEDDEPPMKEEV